MARNFPRFLYTVTTDAKSNGIFITHCLDPILVIKFPLDGSFALEDIIWDKFAGNSYPTEKVRKIVQDARQWGIAKFKNEDRINHG